MKKIDQQLITRISEKGTAECIILLKDRVVFDRKMNNKTKVEKARYVYHALVANADKSQASIIAMCKLREIPYQSFYVTNAIKLTADMELIDELAARPEVEKILDNASFKMLDYTIENSITESRAVEPEWGIRMIKADSVWQMGYRGQGVTIAGQDTGYDWSVSPLRSKYKGTIDSVSADHNFHWHDAIAKNSPQFPDSLINPCGYRLNQPCDDNNHGTHTMGTMVGEDAENSIGVSPDSKWIACRNMDRGWGQLSTYMECFEWFLAPYDLDGKNADPDKAPHVINNSWYCSPEEGCNITNWGVMEEVISNLKASGVVVVVSAGNSGSNCGSVSGPPAIFAPSFSVGATNQVDSIAGFSSRGPVTIDSSFILKPNVSAPGVGVKSVIKGGSFAAFNGTSMAGPHVAGLVGLLISANPQLAGQVDIIEDIIESTAVAKTSDQNCGNFPGTSVPNAIYGYGRVDALAAVKRALDFTINTDEESIGILKVFPNPAYDLLTIALNGGNQTFDNIMIYDMNGSIVQKQIFTKGQILTTLDIQHLPQGVYVYGVGTAKEIIKGKFVKM